MSRLIKVQRSPIHGRGVFAKVDIPKASVLIEYGGRRISHRSADSLASGGVESGHTFLFTLNDKYVINGADQGNIARWINHSCAPNCESLLEEKKPGHPSIHDRIIIQSLRTIKAGEEIFYDYHITLEERHTPRLKQIWACYCRAKRCRKTILHPKKS